METRDERPQSRKQARRIKPALGRQLLTALRHQRDLRRLDRQRRLHDLLCDRHLQVERDAKGALEPAHVVILDMPAVLAQMADDAGGSGAFTRARSLHRIRNALPALLPQRGDMINVNAQTHRLLEWPQASSEVARLV